MFQHRLHPSSSVCSAVGPEGILWFSDWLTQFFRRRLGVTQHLGVVPDTVAAFQLYMLPILRLLFTGRIEMQNTTRKQVCHPTEFGRGVGVQIEGFFQLCGCEPNQYLHLNWPVATSALTTCYAAL